MCSFGVFTTPRIKITYPIRRGVEGGVHGELPSLYEPFNEAPCLRRTAFNRFNVEILKPCLNDCKVTIGNYERFHQFKCKTNIYVHVYEWIKMSSNLQISMVHAFHASLYYGIDHIVQVPPPMDIDYRVIRISFATPPPPVKMSILYYCKFANFNKTI